MSGRGAGSKIVRWSVPGLVGTLAFGGTIVLVDAESKDVGDDGDGGTRTLVFGAEVSVRWHSFRRIGIEDAGRSAGMEKAWM